MKTNIDPDLVKYRSTSRTNNMADPYPKDKTTLEGTALYPKSTPNDFIVLALG